jgi:hypothetical protein
MLMPRLASAVPPSNPFVAHVSPQIAPPTMSAKRGIPRATAHTCCARGDHDRQAQVPHVMTYDLVPNVNGFAQLVSYAIRNGNVADRVGGQMDSVALGIEHRADSRNSPQSNGRLWKLQPHESKQRKENDERRRQVDPIGQSGAPPHGG